jgi:hypothetical protein
VLPAAEHLQHPFFMAEQLGAWLQGSPLLKRLEQRLQQIQEVRHALPRAPACADDDA